MVIQLVLAIIHAMDKVAHAISLAMVMQLVLAIMSVIYKFYKET